jgi:hypothetical protein
MHHYNLLSLPNYLPQFAFQADKRLFQLMNSGRSESMTESNHTVVGSDIYRLQFLSHFCKIYYFTFSLFLSKYYFSSKLKEGQMSRDFVNNIQQTHETILKIFLFYTCVYLKSTYADLHYETSSMAQSLTFIFVFDLTDGKQLPQVDIKRREFR